MKNIKYIIFFSLLVLPTYSLRSQDPVLLVNAVIDSVMLTNLNTLELNLKVQRKSTHWKYWANGTFMFTFLDSTLAVDSNHYSLEYISNTSDLDLSPFPGRTPKYNYYMTPRIYPGRFSITVVGPESWANCITTPLDNENGIKIGRFRITKLDQRPISPYLKWKTPYSYYQACAYKSDHDSIVDGFVFAYENDDQEMDNGKNTKAEYEIKQITPPITKIQNFKARYTGSKKVELAWETHEEYNVAGYVIARGYKTPDIKQVTDVIFTDTIADFRKPYPPHNSCIGGGTNKDIRKYLFVYDSVPFRDLAYCYELMYLDIQGNLHPKLAYDSLPIPNSVIAWAEAHPNPFSDHTTVKYQLDDDVYLSAKVYDLQGKLVETLINGELKKVGSWEVQFNAPAFAQQGLYDVVFIASPIDDPTIEQSHAVVKLQLLK